MKNVFFFGLLGLLIASCSNKFSATQNKDKQKDQTTKSLTLDENQVSAENALESYLNRTPGVTVNGSGSNATVTIRGVNSFSGNTQPLFVVNGTDVGNSYSNAANLLKGMKIKSVEVLKGADATLYGVRGSGGVILIKAQ